MKTSPLGFYTLPLNPEEREYLVQLTTPFFRSLLQIRLYREVVREGMVYLHEIAGSLRKQNSSDEFQKQVTSNLRLFVRRWANKYPEIPELSDETKFWMRLSYNDLSQQGTLIRSPELELFWKGASKITVPYNPGNDHDLVTSANRILREDSSKRDPMSLSDTVINKYNDRIFERCSEEIDRGDVPEDFYDILTECAEELRTIQNQSSFYPEILAHYKEMIARSQHPEKDHLVWMISEISDNKNQSLTKKHRWLGFIQGTLIAEGLTTVAEERDFTRGIFNGA